MKHQMKTQNKQQFKKKSKKDRYLGIRKENSRNFTFDKNPNKEKEIKPNYKEITYLTSFKSPDLYCGKSVLKSNWYKNIDSIEKANTEEVKEIQKENENDEGEVEIENKIKKDNRYFEINNDIECRNCREIGHISRFCPQEIICNGCNMRGHIEKECTYYVKCFKCNKIGHKFFDCTLGKNKDVVVKCASCNSFGHTALDCLKYPMKILKKDTDIKSVKCYFCSKNHFCCKLYSVSNDDIIYDYDSDKYDIDNSDDEPSKKLKQGVHPININSIKRTIYCMRCSGEHKVTDCKKKGFENKFENLRKKMNKREYKNESKDDSFHSKKNFKSKYRYDGQESKRVDFNKQKFQKKIVKSKKKSDDLIDKLLYSFKKTKKKSKVRNDNDNFIRNKKQKFQKKYSNEITRFY